MKIQFRPNPKPEKVFKEKKKYVYKKKASGELGLFQFIWNKLKIKACEVCSSKVEFSPSVFSHILSKGSHPAFKLKEENISIMCFDCHYLWDNGSKSELAKNINWNKIFERRDKLKEEYNKKDQ